MKNIEIAEISIKSAVEKFSTYNFKNEEIKSLIFDEVEDRMIKALYSEDSAIKKGDIASTVESLLDKNSIIANTHQGKSELVQLDTCSGDYYYSFNIHLEGAQREIFAVIEYSEDLAGTTDFDNSYNVKIVFKAKDN